MILHWNTGVVHEKWASRYDQIEEPASGEPFHRYHRSRHPAVIYLTS